jgi:hypothetical protein
MQRISRIANCRYTWLPSLCGLAGFLGAPLVMAADTLAAKDAQNYGTVRVFPISVRRALSECVRLGSVVPDNGFPSGSGMRDGVQVPFVRTVIV